MYYKKYKLQNVHSVIYIVLFSDFTSPNVKVLLIKWCPYFDRMVSNFWTLPWKSLAYAKIAKWKVRLWVWDDMSSRLEGLQEDEEITADTPTHIHIYRIPTPCLSPPRRGTGWEKIMTKKNKRNLTIFHNVFIRLKIITI